MLACCSGAEWSKALGQFFADWRFEIVHPTPVRASVSCSKSLFVQFSSTSTFVEATMLCDLDSAVITYPPHISM